VEISATDGETTNIAAQDISWTATDLAGKFFSSDTIRIRKGDSLLLTATGTGTTLNMDANGDGVYEFSGMPGDKFPALFDTPGTYAAKAKMDGVEIGSLMIHVLDADIHKPIACEVGFQREKNVVISPITQRTSVIFTTNDSYLMDESEKGAFSNTDGQGTTIYLKAKKRGTPILLARLPGVNGAMVACKEIDEFTRDTPALESLIINADSRIGTTTLTMRPYIPNIEFRLKMFAHTSTFSGGATQLICNTSDIDHTTGQTVFSQVFDPATGEIVGEYVLDLEVPAGERAYCFNAQPWQASSKAVPIGEQGAINGTGAEVTVSQIFFCAEDTLPKNLEVVVVTGAQVDWTYSFDHFRHIYIQNSAGTPNEAYFPTGGGSGKTKSKVAIDISREGAHFTEPTLPGNTPKIYNVKIDKTVFQDRIVVVEVKNAKMTTDVICADGNSTAQGSADIAPAGRMLKWTIEGDALGCSIDASGKVTAGTTGGTVTVRAADSQATDCYSETTLTLVKVENATVNPAEIPADGASISQASAIVTPSDRTLKWSITDIDAKGCTIDANTGIITAGNTGTTITVRAEDSQISGASAEAVLTVVKVGPVTLIPPIICADGISTSQGSATVTPAGRALKWSIQGNALGCVIDAATGKVTAGLLGGVIIVRAEDSQVSGAFAEASLTVVKVENATVNPAEIPADGASISQASAIVTPSDRTLKWSITDIDAKGCTIDANTGIITAGNTGTTITVRAEDSQISGASAEAVLTVVKVGPVTLIPPIICADGISTSQGSATVTPAGRALKWSIQGNALGCVIDAATGKVTAGTSGIALTVRAADSVVSSAFSEAVLNVVSVELKSITFGGTKNHKVINYNADYAGDGATPYPSPEWTKTGTENPICYEKDSTQILTTVVTAEPASVANLSVSIKVKHGTAEDTFSQTVNGGDNTCTFTMANIKSVNSVQKATAWTLDFTWSLNSTTYSSMGSSTNQLYTIYGSPTGSLTEKRLTWCTEKANGKASVSDIAAAIGPDATANARFNINNSMYGTPPTLPWNVLDGIDADCVTLSHLMHYALDLLGTSGSEVRFVYSRHASWSGIWSTSSSANEQYNGEDLGFDSGGWNNYEACCYVASMWWMGGAGASKSSAYAVLMQWTQPNTNSGGQRQCIFSHLGQAVTYPGNITVPNVVGLTQAAASNLITNNGLSISTVTTAHSTTVPVGQVISQSPAAGTSISGGTVVDLVISVGP
jgi:hypothetical protein